jgi:hypothetical protein
VSSDEIISTRTVAADFANADESLLGVLVTDHEFLDELAQHRTMEYKMREIFKSPHIFYIVEPERYDPAGLPLENPPTP